MDLLRTRSLDHELLDAEQLDPGELALNLREMALLNRLPILVWAGAALLGWIAGDVIATDPAVHPKLQALFAGPAGVQLDALLGSLGIGPQFASGNGGEVACAVLGVIVVLIAGSIWRRRRLQNTGHSATLAVDEAAQQVDRR